MTWVTYRKALQMGLTHKQICALESTQVHAPNGIKWQAYKVGK